MHAPSIPLATASMFIHVVEIVVTTGSQDVGYGAQNRSPNFTIPADFNFYGIHVVEIVEVRSDRQRD